MTLLLSQNLLPLDIFIGYSKQHTWHHKIQNVGVGNRHDDIIILILIINHIRHCLSSSSSAASTSIDYSNNNQGGRDRLIEGSRGILQVIWTCYINISGYVFFFHFCLTKSRQQTQQTNDYPPGHHCHAHQLWRLPGLLDTEQIQIRIQKQTP